ncbi:MAG: tyrosine-protein phosphatase, partial [Bacteroidales bacterium]|nr:tyrosine-protein phosphatase [Bacteroidales bacterium]
RAELDLRGNSDHLSATPFEDADFLSPIIEEGYTQMLRDDKEKTRQCMQFIMDKVAEGKPVYFHCSLGRDRTGTISMLTLGVLGVDEGEISKEYELTQFAPYGYSVSSGESTRMTRMVDYKGAANFIWSNYAKDGSFEDGVQAYLLEIGISQKDIDDFRKNMLTD